MCDLPDEILRPWLASLVCKNKPNNVILLYVQQEYNEVWSLSYLKKRLRQFGLRRSGAVSSADLLRAVSSEIQTSSRHVGIRQMQLRLRLSRNLLVTREQTALALSVLDPVASARRRARAVNRRVSYVPGPNFSWSCDGYDKLKNFSIEIHGCLDEYSRKIIWLRAYVSNRDPHIVAGYFVNAVKEFGIVPKMTKSDFGQEVHKLVMLQCKLREHHSDVFSGSKSHRYTTSTFNQTIEGYWSRYRRCSTDWWICEFNKLKDEGYYCKGNFVDKYSLNCVLSHFGKDSCRLSSPNLKLPKYAEDFTCRHCLLFVYLPLLEEEIRMVREHHDAHYIRKQRHRLRPHGCPDDIFRFSEVLGATQQGLPISSQELLAACDAVNVAPPDSTLPDYLPFPFRRICEAVLLSNSVQITKLNASAIYILLRNYLNERL